MAKAKASDYKVTTLEPPKIKRGTRGSSIPTEVLDEFIKRLEAGESPTDGNVYKAPTNDEKGHNKARQSANSVAARFKKAIVNYESSPYEELSQIRSRVWDHTGEGEFVFVLQKRETGEPAE